MLLPTNATAAQHFCCSSFFCGNQGITWLDIETAGKSIANTWLGKQNTQLQMVELLHLVQTLLVSSCALMGNVHATLQALEFGCFCWHTRFFFSPSHSLINVLAQDRTINQASKQQQIHSAFSNFFWERFFSKLDHYKSYLTIHFCRGLDTHHL